MSDLEPFNFDEVYREHISYIWKTMQRLGAQSHDLEDLAHDVFSVVHRKRDTFEAGRPIRPWLFGIAFRVAADARRRAAKRGVATEDNQLADGGPSVDQVTDTRRVVLQGLSQISLAQRAVIIMHDLDGYTAPEIAESLQIPLNTVYSRLRLGRSRFVLGVRTLQESGHE